MHEVVKGVKNTSGVSILMQGVISFPNSTSCDDYRFIKPPEKAVNLFFALFFFLFISPPKHMFWVLKRTV